MSLTPAQLQELQTIVLDLGEEFPHNADALWGAAIRMQVGDLGPTSGSGGQAAFDAAVADIKLCQEEVRNYQQRQGSPSSGFDVAVLQVVPATSTFPSGNVGEVLYLDIAPNNYVATDQILITPAGPNSVQMDEVGTTVARTVPAASGGMEINNLSSGAGFERVLTVSDSQAHNAEFVTMSLSANIPNERVLVAGAGISLTDGGAGGNVTLDVDNPLPSGSVDGDTLYWDQTGGLGWLATDRMTWDQGNQTLLLGQNDRIVLDAFSDGGSGGQITLTKGATAALTASPFFVTNVSGDKYIFGAEDNFSADFFGIEWALAASLGSERVNFSWTTFSVGGLPLSFQNNGSVHLVDGLHTFNDGSYYVTEMAAAQGDAAGRGQFWVRDDAPNVPMFTDDVGTDFVLTSGNFATPLIIAANINTATPPTTETPTGVVEIWDADETDLLGHFGFLVSNQLQVVNYFHGGDVLLRAQDSGAVTRTLFFGNPDGITSVQGGSGVILDNIYGTQPAFSSVANGASTLYYNGAARFVTASGGVDVSGDITVAGLVDGASLILPERAAAIASVATLGQFWVRDDAPNVPMFTDDAGTDFILNGTLIPSGTVEGTTLYWDNTGTQWLENTIVRFDSVGSQLRVHDPADLTRYIALDWRTSFNPRLDLGSNRVGGASEILTPGQMHFFSTTGAMIFRVNSGATTVTPNLALDHNGVRAQIFTGVGDGYIEMFSNNGTDDIRFAFGTGLKIQEKAAAYADIAAYGQFWVRNDVPNVPMFTDDAGTDFNLLAAAQTPWVADIDGDGFNLTDAGVIFQREQTTADGDVAGAGQIWVRDDTPNDLMFTDDAGNDFSVAYAPARVTINAGFNFNTAGNRAANWVGYYADGGNNTVTTENSSSVVNWPVGTAVQVLAPGSGVITIAEGTGVTIFFDDGSDSVGGFTVSQGVITIFRATTTDYIAWGSGITP